MSRTPYRDAIRLALVRRKAATGEARTTRERARLPQQAVADAIGVDVSTVHRWEAGERQPTGPQALAYLDLLEELDRMGAGDAASA